nr:hypothetical protein [Ochrobactrum sp. LM19]
MDDGSTSRLISVLFLERTCQGRYMRLSIAEASVAADMIRRGDKLHDVAAWFGVNPDRIVATKGEIPDMAEARTQLPPSGAPGLKGRRLHNAARAAIAALEAGNRGDALIWLRQAVAQFERNE